MEMMRNLVGREHSTGGALTSPNDWVFMHIAFAFYPLLYLNGHLRPWSSYAILYIHVHVIHVSLNYHKLQYHYNLIADTITSYQWFIMCCRHFIILYDHHWYALITCWSAFVMILLTIRGPFPKLSQHPCFLVTGHSLVRCRASPSYGWWWLRASLAFKYLPKRYNKYLETRNHHESRISSWLTVIQLWKWI